MGSLLANAGIWEASAGRVMLVAHLLVATFALGTVTHHWWTLLRGGKAPPGLPRLAKYARWMAVGYPLAWLFGVVIYPSYNVLIRKGPLMVGGHGWLEDHAPWAVGLFEIKEHLGTIALVMLPWLVLSASRYGQLERAERISYIAATWVFTLFVYYSFIAGGIVTSVRSF